MVAIIERAADIRETVLYNEHKLPEGGALLLAAFNFRQEVHTLTLDDKLHRFKELIHRNERVKQHTLHFSLNFHPVDDPTDRKMKQIAAQFTKKIGFADQPALVYRHLDAGHPHMHIVTTSIQINGDRIKNDRLSHRQLIKICREIGQQHNLTPAILPNHPQSQEQYIRQLQSHTQAHILKYGKIPTKTGIQAVLDKVLKEYNYTSLEQLNAALNLYNVRADRGHPQGAMYRSKGLYYRMLDDNGQKVGAPIKASAFNGHPILRQLEKNFIANELKVRPGLEQTRSRIRTNIDWTLVHNPQSMKRWITGLQKENIGVVIPIYRQQPMPDFFFIDFQNKTIHQGSELGEKYTAAAILKRSGLERALCESLQQKQLTLPHKKDISLLQDPAADPAKRLGLLISLARQHNHWVDARKNQRQLQQQQSHEQEVELKL